MMEKISYLKGLMDGLGVHPESREGRLFGAVCAALEESAEYIERLEEHCNILEEELDALIENKEYGCDACPSESKHKYFYPDKPEISKNVPLPAEDEDEEEPEETKESEANPEFSDVNLEVSVVPAEEEESEDEDTGDFLDDEEYETICPTCGKVILLDEQMLEEGEIVCPNCGEELEFDFDDEEIEKLSPDAPLPDLDGSTKK